MRHLITVDKNIFSTGKTNIAESFFPNLNRQRSNGDELPS